MSRACDWEIAKGDAAQHGRIPAITQSTLQTKDLHVKSMSRRNEYGGTASCSVGNLPLQRGKQATAKSIVAPQPTCIPRSSPTFKVTIRFSSCVSVSPSAPVATSPLHDGATDQTLLPSGTPFARSGLHRTPPCEPPAYPSASRGVPPPPHRPRRTRQFGVTQPENHLEQFLFKRWTVAELLRGRMGILFVSGPFERPGIALVRGFQVRQLDGCDDGGRSGISSCGCGPCALRIARLLRVQHESKAGTAFPALQPAPPDGGGAPGQPSPPWRPLRSPTASRTEQGGMGEPVTQSCKGLGDQQSRTALRHAATQFQVIGGILHDFIQ